MFTRRSFGGFTRRSLLACGEVGLSARFIRQRFGGRAADKLRLANADLGFKVKLWVTRL